MKPEEVGTWRFCPACARKILPPEFVSEDPEHGCFNYEAVRCSGCNRPWVACCCKPLETKN